jgi:hypothetical protein
MMLADVMLPAKQSKAKQSRQLQAEQTSRAEQTAAGRADEQSRADSCRQSRRAEQRTDGPRGERGCGDGSVHPLPTVRGPLRRVGERKRQ